METYAYVEITNPCIYKTQVQERKLIYSEPECFDIEQITLGQASPGNVNPFLTPYFFKVYDEGCFLKKVNFGVMPADDIKKIPSLSLPEPGQQANFIITEIYNGGVNGEPVFYTGSLSVGMPLVFHFEYPLVSDILASSSGSFYNCKDAEVPIPIISDEVSLPETPYISQNYVSQYFLWIVFLLAFLLLGILWIKKYFFSKHT